MEKFEYNKYNCNTTSQIVKPIDIDSTLGFIHIVNYQLENFNKQLPKNRYQGDNIKNILFENIGETYARIMIILNTTMEEIQKLEPGEDTICDDLTNCPNSMLRAIEGYLKFFAELDNSDVLIEEYLKTVRYGSNNEDIKTFIKELDISNKHKQYLLKLDQFDI